MFDMAKRAEQRLLDYIGKRFCFLSILFLMLLSIAIRFLFRDHISVDLRASLIPWFERFQEGGGIKALSYQIGNYNMLYQSLLALLTYLPLKPIHALKLSSTVFDYFLACTCASLLFQCIPDKKIAGYAAMTVLLSPLVFLNSAWWAECDAMISFFSIYSLKLYNDGKIPQCFAILGVAFSLKMLAIIILPIYLFLYVYDRKISLLHFAEIPIVMLLSAVPNVIAGRGLRGFVEVFTQALIANEQRVMYANYPSFWALTGSIIKDDTHYFEVMRLCAYLFTIVVIAGLMIYWWYIKVEINKRNVIYMTFLLSYTCVLFLPSMHERYGFPYEVIGIVIMYLLPKTIIPWILLNMLSLETYLSCLVSEISSDRLYPMAWINLGVFIVYVYLLNKEIKKTAGRCSCLVKTD